MNKHPKICNICGGNVAYTTNDKIYGRKYGSGYAYLCTNCGAYVGTHKPRPKEALGILANAEMRTMKMKCHDIFDGLWKNREQRNKLYERLSKELQIPVNDCHFGYFDLNRLNEAYEILKTW